MTTAIRKALTINFACLPVSSCCVPLHLPQPESVLRLPLRMISQAFEPGILLMMSITLGGIRLNYVVKGVKALRPASSKCPPHPPITIHMLKLLSVHLDFSSHLDICMFACALITFWTQSHLGKILSKTQSNMKSSHDVPTLTDLYNPITLSRSQK